MKKYRIGIIGCGWIACFYARILPGLQDRAEVVWVALLDCISSAVVCYIQAACVNPSGSLFHACFHTS